MKASQSRLKHSWRESEVSDSFHLTWPAVVAEHMIFQDKIGERGEICYNETNKIIVR